MELKKDYEKPLLVILPMADNVILAASFEWEEEKPIDPPGGDDWWT